MEFKILDSTIEFNDSVLTKFEHIFESKQI